MKNLSLIQKPELFQGENYLKSNNNYFEGWYFKNTINKYGISFIPGININSNEKKAFVQIITNDSSYFVNYSINDFEFNSNPFYIKVNDNFFSKDRININIKDSTQNLKISGDIEYSNNKNINTNFFSPNIMGPFSYIPFMECNHAILSMKNTCNGVVNVNNNSIIFDNGIGYIEKDWGNSFPKSYIWCQGNNFKTANVSFMLSIADIPFKAFHFRGFICDLIINNKEFKFTTYNNSKIIKYDISNNNINITVKKGKYYLNIMSDCLDSFRLSAPVKGKMVKDIFESISSKITLTLKVNNRTIFSDTSTNCGLEIV